MAKLAKVELSCHPDINANSKIIKLKRRDGDERGWKKSNAVLGGSPFLVTRPGSVAQVLSSWAKRDTVERLAKLYLK